MDGAIWKTMSMAAMQAIRFPAVPSIGIGRCGRIQEVVLGTAPPLVVLVLRISVTQAQVCPQIFKSCAGFCSRLFPDRHRLGARLKPAQKGASRKKWAGSFFVVGISKSILRVHGLGVARGGVGERAAPVGERGTGTAGGWTTGIVSTGLLNVTDLAAIQPRCAGPVRYIICHQSPAAVFPVTRALLNCPMACAVVKGGAYIFRSLFAETETWAESRVGAGGTGTVDLLGGGG